MALFEFVSSAGAASCCATADHAITGPRAVCDAFDNAQPGALGVAAAVFGLLLIVGIFDRLRRSR